MKTMLFAVVAVAGSVTIPTFPLAGGGSIPALAMGGNMPLPRAAFRPLEALRSPRQERRWCAPRSRLLTSRSAACCGNSRGKPK